MTPSVPLARTERFGSGCLTLVVRPKPMWTCAKCGEKIEDQFDSCWKCSVMPEPVQKMRRPLTLSFFMLAVFMSGLAPLLADLIHSAYVVIGGSRMYNAELSYIASSGFWIFLATRAVLTFLLVWVLAKIGFAHMLVWSCSVILWLFVDAEMTVALK